MGQVGRRLVEERVAWDRQQVCYLQVYRSLLECSDAKRVSALSRLNRIRHLYRRGDAGTNGIG